MIELGGARGLGPAAQEVVRLRVVAALESGQVRTYRRAAEVFGVSERSVGTWWRKYKAAGRESLAAVGKWLRRHGFSPQRPDRRSYRQDQAKVDAWLGAEYPAIAAQAKAEHAVVAWADQCGLRSDTAPPGRSWAPAGQSPTVKVSGRRFRVNIMSAIASRGSLWFTVFTGKFTAKVFTLFLDRLARQAGRKVHVIADRHPVHRSKAVRTWLDANAERIELHLMPGYSPELNPDEILNADIKRNVHAARARSVNDLARETRRFLHRRQRQPRRVQGYFHARHVRYTLE
ncbi:IS630 family transposase [Streptomyces sp. NBC_01431]|uniref:IS630 family transposase n=1 Tax=Streptomyces sp. NBC_01431 TaxID=2903863 RepID=UPI002E353166|nr:IS630 family transposase [Streptomyces sp. NBC_01431]